MKLKRTITEEIDDILQGGEVNLTSFSLQDKLNPDFWDSSWHLDNDIRISLIGIGFDFYNSMKLDELGISGDFLKDMVFVGSLASFNYSKYADVDLHLLVDIESLGLNGISTELLKKYFTQCKSDWNSSHSELTVHGYDVEVYVQDVSERNAANGVYSLFHDKWIKRPDKMRQSFDTNYVKRKSEKYIGQIDYLEQYLSNLQPGDSQAEKVADICELLKNKIVSGRKDSLNSSNGDEIADGNIIFKVLRRTGHLGKLWKLIDSAYDKAKSINETHL